jgi:flagellar motor switch protein FliM
VSAPGSQRGIETPSSAPPADVTAPAAPGVAARAAVRAFDLVGDNRAGERGFPALDAVDARFARRLRRSLSAMIGSGVGVRAGALGLPKASALRERWHAPASLWIFTMAPLRGEAVLALSPPLAFALVDRAFGGTGPLPERLGPREPSAVEQQVLHQLVSRILADLGGAWKPLHPVECRVVRAESNPAAVPLGLPGDLVFAREVAIDVAGDSAPLTVGIPAALLDPLRGVLGEPRADTREADREWTAALQAVVRASDVTVTAEIGAREMSTRELLRLRVGDVVSLGIRPDDPLMVRVEGVRLLSGVAGNRRGNNAVRVLRRNGN